MFKRGLCCILLCTLLCTLLPSGALAGQGSEALQQLMNVHYLDQLCAVSSNAPDWHQGMSLDHANSLQTETALVCLLEDEIQPVLSYLEQTAVAQVKTGLVTGELSDELRQARDECRSLRDTVQAQLDIIKYERSTLPQNAAYVYDGTYLTENQTEAAARRVLLGIQRLESGMSTTANLYAEWSEKTANLKKLVCPDDSAANQQTESLTPLQAHIVGVRADYMNTLLESAKRITDEEREFSSSINRDDEAEIYAVPLNKILFDIRYENGAPVTDANVVVRCIKTGDSFNGTYDKDAEGYLFATASLGMEDDGFFEIGYEISKIGYETQYVNWYLGQGADIYRTVLVPTDGSTYISGAAFNDEDMLWNVANIYITDANDADQTISVYLDRASGTPSGEVTMFYKDRNGIEETAMASAKAGSDGRVRADFIGKWCQIFNIGDTVSFSLNGNNVHADQVQTQLAANKPECSDAGVDKPQFESDNETLMARFLPSEDIFKVVIPEDVFLFGGTTVGLNFPGATSPVSITEGLDGSLFAVFGHGADIKTFHDNYIEGDKWKTTKKALQDRDFNKMVKRDMDKSKNGGQDFSRNEDSQKKPFFDKATAWWNLFFCLQGKTEVDETTKVKTATGQVSAGFTIGMTWEKSKQVCATPPIRLEVGISIGVGATMYGLFAGEFQPNTTFSISKMDVEFGAVSIMIPVSIYIAAGAGVKFLNAGVKGSFSLNLSLPIISLDYDKSVGVSVDARVTFYAQILLVHAEWLLARISWALENGESGDVNGYVIGIGELPKNSALKKGFSMPNGTLPQTDLRVQVGPLFDEGDIGTSSTNIDPDTNVIWNYAPASIAGSTAVQNEATLPKKFSMQYSGESMSVNTWIENNRIMFSPNDMDHPRELVIPDDPAGSDTPLAKAKKGIESGEYKIIDVNVNSGESHSDRIGSYLTPVVIGMVAVTYAKSFKTVQQTVGDKVMEVTVPEETETLVMMLIKSGDNPVLLRTDTDAPAAFVLLNTTDTIRELYPFTCDVHLKESPLHANTPCIDSAGSIGVLVGAYLENGDLCSGCYGFQTQKYNTEYYGDSFECLEMGLTDDYPVVVGYINGLPLSGSLWSVGALDWLSIDGDPVIDDFVLYDLPDTDGEMVAFYLEPTAQEGVDALKAVPMKLDKKSFAFNVSSTEIWDFETDVPAAKLFSDAIINQHSLNTTLYWYDSGLKDVDGSGEKKDIARVRGVYFDWYKRKATKPFTIATLYGNDGDIGDLVPVLTPVSSFVDGGKLYFTRVLEKDNVKGENDSMDVQMSDYMLYSAPLTTVAKMRVIGLAPEYHAMSAGRTGNFTFTLLNDGNTPVLSATMELSRITKKDDGSETKETVATYTVCPESDAQNETLFWSVGSNIPDVRKGQAAAHRVDTIFDQLPGNPLDNDAEANDDPSILASFIPGTISAYKGSLLIPEDWDGLQLLRAEVVKAYGPYGIDANGKTQMVEYDLQNGFAYAMDEKGNVSNTPLLTSNGTLLKVERSQPIDLEVDVAEISMSCKMHVKNGEKYISTSISQNGDTAMNVSTGNITLCAYVDDEMKYPSYVHTFKNHTSGDISLNLDAPVSLLTGGRKVEKLKLVVSDTAEGNTELSIFNNSEVFFLNEGLRWRTQPINQTALAGHTVTFTAEAEGGTQPYAYTWTRIHHYGMEVVGIGSVLTLANCTDAMNGDAYYCTVMDANGQKLNSAQAILTVQTQVIPATGDSQNPYTLAAANAASAVACVIIVTVLFRKRKKA